VYERVWRVLQGDDDRDPDEARRHDCKQYRDESLGVLVFERRPPELAAWEVWSCVERRALSKAYTGRDCCEPSFH
jgi:hypothetical protein